MYNPEDDGSALDAALFIEMREALLSCMTELRALVPQYTVHPGNSALNKAVAVLEKIGSEKYDQQG